MEQLGKGTGVLVFVVGIVLLCVVFFSAYALFNQINDALHGVGLLAPPEKPPGMLKTLSPVAWFGINVGMKFLGLIVLGYLASLIAHQGAVMCGAMRGRSEP